jgi:hypothetical protein
MSGEGGIRHSRENPEETTHFAKGGAESGANDPENKAIDPGLALVIERWDTLADAIRAGIVAMVAASTPSEVITREPRQR